MSLSTTVNRKVSEIESWSWNFRKDGEFGWGGDGVDGVDGIDRVNRVDVIDRSDGVDRLTGLTGLMALTELTELTWLTGWRVWRGWRSPVRYPIWFNSRSEFWSFVAIKVLMITTKFNIWLNEFYSSLDLLTQVCISVLCKTPEKWPFAIRCRL